MTTQVELVKMQHRMEPAYLPAYLSVCLLEEL